MSKVRGFAQAMGWTCVAIGGLQLLGGTRTEPGLPAEPTVDSHVRFMGPMFIGYGLGWLDAARGGDPARLRVLAGLMGLGGAGRLVTRATLGRPHRFHDALLAVELTTPVATEALVRSGSWEPGDTKPGSGMAPGHRAPRRCRA